MAYNPDAPSKPENFFALINRRGEVVNVISYDEKEGMFERVEGKWAKMSKGDSSPDGMRIVYVSPDVIRLYDGMYNYTEPLQEEQLEPYNTEATVATEKAGK